MSEYEPKICIQSTDEWISYIQEGRKSVDLRPNVGKFKALQVGDVVKFHTLTGYAICKITSLPVYSDVQEAIVMEGIRRVLPGMVVDDEDDLIEVATELARRGIKGNGEIVAINYRVLCYKDV